MSTSTRSRNHQTVDPFTRLAIDVDDAAGSLGAELLRLAASELEQGHVREAEAYLEQALAQHPDDHRCQAFLAVCEATRRPGSGAAERVAREIHERHPRDPVACFAFGQVLLQAGRRRDAFRLMARARQLSGGERQLRQQITRAEPRREPVFSALSRNHPLNVLAGRLRARFSRR